MLETQFKRVQQRFARAVVPGETGLFQQVQTELNEYFDGLRQSFEFPLALEGTDFQELVWNELLEIPFGSDGSLSGYGGGFWRKQWLLEHERASEDETVGQPPSSALLQ